MLGRNLGLSGSHTLTLHLVAEEGLPYPCYSRHRVCVLNHDVFEKTILEGLAYRIHSLHSNGKRTLCTNSVDITWFPYYETSKSWKKWLWNHDRVPMAGYSMLCSGPKMTAQWAIRVPMFSHYGYLWKCWAEYCSHQWQMERSPPCVSLFSTCWDFWSRMPKRIVSMLFLLILSGRRMHSA